jgi:hypothetical protein
LPTGQGRHVPSPKFGFSRNVKIARLRFHPERSAFLVQVRAHDTTSKWQVFPMAAVESSNDMPVHFMGYYALGFAG